MNSKGQQGPIGFVFMTIFSLIVLALIGGELFGLFTLGAITANLSGLELFLMSNFPVWIIGGVLLGVLMFFWRSKTK